MQWQDWGRKLLVVGSVLAFGTTLPVLAQNPPAKTYQPGPWQPIARINPKRPVSITLVNQTPVALQFGLLGDARPKSLAAGGSAKLNNVDLPAYLDINPTNDTGMKYQVTASDNVITVVVQATTTPGARVINIAETGAIYVY